MSDRPTGQDLLLTAREELMKRLLPALPADLRYQALMVANAMAIAARELEAGHAGDAREMTGLQKILEGEELDMEGSRKKLCAQIRAGRFDAGKPGHKMLLQHLVETTRDKLVISNPKMLASKAAG